MSLTSPFNLFFPHLVGLDISGAFRHSQTVHITAATTTRTARCPDCATPSRRVHSRYERRLTNTPASGQEILIHLRVRRFFCDHTACERKIFAEQVPGLTLRYDRRTPHLTELLTHLALAFGGRAGARLTGRLAAAVSRMTLLRLIRAIPDPEPDVPRVLGVDDFALLKGHVYGTLLVDVDTRRPMDLLDKRTAEALQDWLCTHPGVEVICRDRASCYADGAKRGAPNAIQVADRWHLWRNLCEAVERVVASHRDHLGHRRAPAATDPHPDGPAAEPVDQQPSPPRQRWIAQRTRQRHVAVHDLLAQGQTIMEIARQLGLARNTVRRFACAATAEELLAKDGTGKRPTIIQSFDTYLRKRFMEGCTNAAAL